MEKLVAEREIRLEREIPIKIHSGEPGNVTFIKSNNFTDVIAFLNEQKIKTCFMETNTAAGPRSNSFSHLKIARQHGFTQLPFVVADGKRGFDHCLITITKGVHFQNCQIATKLAKASQVLVISHFKGHIMSGFGGAIKQLGLGFSSGRGKIDIHSKIKIPDDQTIDWEAVQKTENGKTAWNSELVYSGDEFRQRIAEYALAAVNNKKYPYLQYALDITANCDCDETIMKPIYADLGLFASTDPVAIDKACFDLLSERVGKKPFEGNDIFSYAEEIGLGSSKYDLIRLSPTV